MVRYKLWDNIPGTTDTVPYIVHYKPKKTVADGALVIFPGSGLSPLGKYRVNEKKIGNFEFSFKA